MLMRFLYFFLSLLLFQSCIPAFDINKDDVVVDIEDSDVKEIYRLQDEQKLDSLFLFFNDDKATNAYLSTLAFGSILSKNAVDSLAKQLDNPSLEAIGKCGSEQMLNAMSTVSTYIKTDTTLLLGQARGIYRYALRGITSPAGTSRMIALVLDETYPSEVRLIAAHYLARAKEIDLEKSKFQLSKFLSEDPDPDIRMAIARALSKTTGTEIHSYLLNHLKEERDYRVQYNIIKTLENFPYEPSIESILKLLKNENPHLSLAAGQFLVNNGSAAEANFYKTLINDSLDYRVNGKLYEAVLTNLPHYFVNTRKKLALDIDEAIKEYSSPQQKVGYIRALAHNPRSYTLLNEIISETENASVSTAAIESIHSMLSDELFVKTFKSKHILKRKEIADMLIKILKKEDSGLTAIIADIIKDPKTRISDIISETDYLVAAQKKLSLPREIETYNKLGEAISIMNGEEFIPQQVDFNHPINWSILEGITDSTEWVISTSKGNISFVPFTKEAPGSVANFAQLATDNFYDQKIFHRVVPNFVIQGGCPRGDGYGSLDYSIRSEYAPLYYDDEGYIGMASAGPHTEGTQFFITHSPTPHLDGRYTIFGKVKSGMDVVHDILPGDLIKDVIITN